jgi:hypothetical protein
VGGFDAPRRFDAGSFGGFNFGLMFLSPPLPFFSVFADIELVNVQVRDGCSDVVGNAMFNDVPRIAFHQDFVDRIVSVATHGHSTVQFVTV